MRLFGRDDDGVLRILGLPAGLRGLTSSEVRLRCFEPENPRLLVPRTTGLGWDLNLGAVAVRLGLIRPDDSLPDLVDHIPGSTVRMLVAVPPVMTAGTCALAAAVGRRADRLPSGWDATFRPRGWGRPRAALGPLVGVSTVLAGWSLWQNRLEDRGVDVMATAEILGVQAGMAVLVVAAGRGARRPEARSWSAALAPVAVVTVATGVCVAVVRTALDHVATELATRPGPTRR